MSKKNAIFAKGKIVFFRPKIQKKSGHGPKNIQNNPLYYRGGGGESRLL
jgi:hypothetical protein